MHETPPWAQTTRKRGPPGPAHCGSFFFQKKMFPEKKDNGTHAPRGLRKILPLLLLLLPPSPPLLTLNPLSARTALSRRRERREGKQ
jgi:hypothetical protein